MKQNIIGNIRFWIKHVLPVAIAALLIGIFKIYDDFQATTQIARNKLESLVKIGQTNLSDDLSLIEQVLDDLGHQAQQPHAQEQILKYRNRFTYLKNVRHFLVTDAAGVIRYSSNPQVLLEPSLDRPFFTGAIRQMQTKQPLFLSPPIFGKTGALVIFASKAILNEAKKFVGVAVITLEPNFFNLYLDLVKPDTQSELFLINRDAIVISSTPHVGKYEGQTYRVDQAFSAQNNRNWIKSLFNNSSEPNFMATMQLDHHPELAMAVSQPANSSLNQWKARSIFVLLLAALVIGLWGLALTAFYKVQKQTQMLFDQIGKKQSETEIFVENLLETANAMVVGVNTEGIIVVYNSACERILGYTKTEMLERNWFEVICPRHRYPDLWTKFESAAKTGVFLVNSESPVLTKSGQERFISWSNSNIKSPTGDHILISFGIDITDSKLHTEKIRQAMEKAEAASKAKTSFLANVSHEIRTPMSAIVGFTQMAMKSQNKENANRCLEKVLQATSNLLTLVNDLLDASKAESGMFILECTPFDLNATLHNIQDTYSQLAIEKKLEFISKLDENLPHFVLGDSLRLQQILQNLLNNSIKFTKEGRIQLTVKLDKQETDQTHSVIAFIVSDSGLGMTDEQLQQIFKPFGQADSSIARKYGGTGLGLTITAKLIELMGGKIQVQSVQGQGSTFSFSLYFKHTENLKHPVNSLNKQNLPSQAIPNLKGYSILVVEDILFNQQILEGALLETHAQIEVCDNGLEAVDLVKVKKFDFIIMDLQMPIMDGITATKKIRLTPGYEKTPIIAHTAFATKEDKDACLKAGMNDYLTKPLQFSDLHLILAKFLAQS